jgi:hypothetical protein
MVFISESFDLATARKLAFMMMGAQQDEGSLQAVKLHPARPVRHELTASMVRFFAGCGLMRSAVR